MSKVFTYMKPYTLMIICTVALLTVEAACALILPAYMADIINKGVMPGNIPFIWRTGITMLLITIFSTLVAVTTSYFAARIGTGVAGDLRAAVFKKVLSFSSAEMNHFSSSSLITRTTNDIIQVQLVLIMGMRLLVYAPILGTGGIIRALERDVYMSWIVAVATFVMVACMVALFFIVMPKYKKLQTFIDRLNLVSRENLSGILIVRAFSTQRFEKKRFDKANSDLTNTSLFVDQAFATLTPVILLVLNVTAAVIVWVGARRASSFHIEIGDIFAFLQYGMLIIFAFLMVGVMFIYLPRAVVCAARIKEVLETKSSLQYKENAQVFPDDFKGIVEFRNVTFRYPDSTEDDDNTLKDVSFTAEPGKTTAIIGATGSGKSTIFKLLLRFYDASSGGVYFDNINVKDVRKEALLDKIGYIPQKALLFSGSIRSNLMYSDKTATEERLKDAADTAQAAAFIEARDGGYDSNVAQGGANLSGGQKQRISIARALVKNAPIYLFDDSFSALDLKTDALLRAALKRKTSQSTIVVIAQRISTIMDADHIVVLDHGEVVGQGTHFELMSSCEVYREIAASQLTEKEAGL